MSVACSTITRRRWRPARSRTDGVLYRGGTAKIGAALSRRTSIRNEYVVAGGELVHARNRRRRGPSFLLAILLAEAVANIALPESPMRIADSGVQLQEGLMTVWIFTAALLLAHPPVPPTPDGGNAAVVFWLDGQDQPSSDATTGGVVGGVVSLRRTLTAPPPNLTLGLSAAGGAPQFVLECPNPQPRAIPEREPLNDILLRLDGEDVPPPSGGIVGSIPGTIGVDPVIEPGASVRVHLMLTQDPNASVRSGQFGSRFTVSRIVPLAAGRHRLAVRCLGEWSNVVRFEWEP
jgi:hypothetical protein